MRVSMVSTSVALALWGLSSGAHALGFNIADGGGNSVSVEVTTVPGFNSSYRGGEFIITPTGSDGAWPSFVQTGVFAGAAPAGSFISYCVQIPQTFSSYGALSGYSIKSSTVAADYSNGVPPNATISVAQLDRIGRLLTYGYGAGFGSGGVNNAEATALQAGIWEIIYQPSSTPASFDLSSVLPGGTGFRVTTPLTSEMIAVNSWMGTGGAATTLTSYQHFAVLYSPTQQDFLVPVPEPEAYGLAIAGMGVVGFAMRRRRAIAER